MLITDVIGTAISTVKIIGIDEYVMVLNGTPARSTDETFDKGIDSVIVAKMEVLVLEDEVINLS